MSGVWQEADILYGGLGQVSKFPMAPQLHALLERQMVSLMREADPNRVMLHLDSDAPAKMLVALDQAEHLLNKAEQEGRAMQLEVISNSHGIDLLRAGVSPYAERIARLKHLHANL